MGACAEPQQTKDSSHPPVVWAYILLSNRVGENPKSVLLEISENGDVLKTEFDCDFQLVFNMLVSDGKILLGADKAVVVFDLQTKEINAYTPISVEAEENILKKR